MRSAAEEILRSTAAISDASDDLAQRTEQQAAGLEESTAAALHELTQNVTLSAEGAQKAAKVVGLTLNEARASGDVVMNAVSAMGAIEKSSGRNLQDHRRDRRDCLPDQPPGVECRRRGRPRR